VSTAASGGERGPSAFARTVRRYAPAGRPLTITGVRGGEVRRGESGGVWGGGGGWGGGVWGGGGGGDEFHQWGPRSRGLQRRRRNRHRHDEDARLPASGIGFRDRVRGRAPSAGDGFGAAMAARVETERESWPDGDVRGVWYDGMVYGHCADSEPRRYRRARKEVAPGTGKRWHNSERTCTSMICRLILLAAELAQHGRS